MIQEGKRNLFETVLKVENANKDLTIMEDEENLDGLNYLAGKKMSFVNEKAMLSPDMAIRIAKATNTSPESWMNMQQKLTLWEAEQHLPENVIPFPSVHSEEAAALQM